ncbi:MAG: hypothetical protein Q7J59_07130 [Elusimicrobiota bacterium]|nr:hypothetical protein [Elusimicrobiota bacterium]
MLNNDKTNNIAVAIVVFIFFIFPVVFFLYLECWPMNIPRVVKDTKIAYVYHPKTDRLYRIELAATLRRRGDFLWRLFKLYPVWRKDKEHRGIYGDIPPWIPVTYSQVPASGCQYLGYFRDICVDRSKELELMKDHPHQYIDQKNQGIDKILEKTEKFIETFSDGGDYWRGEFDFFELSYYNRCDINTYKLTPDSLSFLNEFYGTFSGDAIITKWKANGGVQTKDVEILKEVLIIRGDAAKELRVFLDWESEDGYYYSQLRSGNKTLKCTPLHWKRKI